MDVWEVARTGRVELTCPHRFDGLRATLHDDNYLLLLDYTARLFREGKAAISREVAEILERLGTTAEIWQARLQKLSKGRLLGRFFGATRERLREVADGLGLRRVPNWCGCPASERRHDAPITSRFGHRVETLCAVCRNKGRESSA